MIVRVGTRETVPGSFMSFGDDALPEPCAASDLVERVLELAERKTAEQRAELARRLDSTTDPRS